MLKRCKREFVIPEYQRPYAVTDEIIHCGRFSQLCKSKSEKTYFLGAIVFMKTKMASRNN